METPILTPMQQAIEKLKEENRIVFGEFMKDDGTNECELASEANGLLTAIRILKTYLPKEQEAIEQAWEDGNRNGYAEAQIEFTDYTIDTGGCANSATEYFNQTYKDNE